MSKSVALLLVLAAAFVLWIGFNPHARQQAARDWEKTQEAFVKIKADISAKTHEGGSASNSRERTGSGSAPSALTVAWRQVVSVFDALWTSLHQIWLELSARIHLSTK